MLHAESPTAAPELPEPREYVDDHGRTFAYRYLERPGADGLGVHFSAFFDRNERTKSLQDFKGYFHRMKMLGSDERRSWLFFCDAYGAFENGTYYTGEAGDLYVERAMRAILERHIGPRRHTAERTVMLGSSMGATAALKFGIEFGVEGIVAIAPHIDLDTSAALQNRMAEVAWACADGDPLAPHNRDLTRQVTNLVKHAPKASLPRLFVQSTKDDHGVHQEQVLPLVAAWKGNGSLVDFDERESGGHTSSYATRGMLLDVVRAFLDGEPVPLDRYQTDLELRGEPPRPSLEHRVRRRLSFIRKGVLTVLRTGKTPRAHRAQLWADLQRDAP